MGDDGHVVAERILTESEASAAVEDIGWRFLLECLTTAVAVGSLAEASDVVRVAVDAAGPDADDHLRLRATADHVELTLRSGDQLRVTTTDVELASTITSALRAADHETLAHLAAHSPQSVQVAIDAMDIPAVRPFWKAVLGYDDVTAPDAAFADLVDPTDGGPSLGPSVWFQQLDEPRPQRNTIHLDVAVPHDEAESRVAAALAAGGRLVSDEHARAFWVLADVEGNEVCVCTWQDRD